MLAEDQTIFTTWNRLLYHQTVFILAACYFYCMIMIWYLSCKHNGFKVMVPVSYMYADVLRKEAYIYMYNRESTRKKRTLLNSTTPHPKKKRRKKTDKNKKNQKTKNKKQEKTKKTRKKIAQNMMRNVGHSNSKLLGSVMIHQLLVVLFICLKCNFWMKLITTSFILTKFRNF